MLPFFTRLKQSSMNSIYKGVKKTTIVCVDDQNIIRDRTIEYIREIVADANVIGFESADEAIAFVREAGCDILFTEIELYGQPTGLELAREMQKLNPRLNIIFTTVCSPNEYAKEVMEIRPSGYLTKVVEIEDIRKAMSSLLYTV